MLGIHQMKQLLALKCSSNQDTQEEINQQMERVVAEATCKLSRHIGIIVQQFLTLYSLSSYQNRWKLNRIR